MLPLMLGACDLLHTALHDPNVVLMDTFCCSVSKQFLTHILSASAWRYENRSESFLGLAS